MPSKFTTESFVQRSQSVWGDRWDYSKVEYVNQLTPITLVCSDHGEFSTVPKKHLAGTNSCRKCTGQEVTTDSFIQKSIRVYGEGRWLYDRVRYGGAFHKVEIGCPIHETYFFQTPNNHLNSIGCRECSQRFSRGKLDLDVVRERAEAVFGTGSLDFSESAYVNSKTPMAIRCVEHDERFEQQPEYLMLGQRRCSQCASVRKSAGEDSLWEFVHTLEPQVQRRSRKLLPPTQQEIDIYVPHLNLGIEYNGLFYHSEYFVSTNYHRDKYLLAEKNGIRLIQIWEDDWLHRRDIVEERLRVLLHKTSRPKVSARSTEVVKITSQQAKEFLNTYHIQGFVGASVHLGLQWDGQLVAVASFKVRNPTEYELTRYATSALVRGGHSKLISHFEDSNKYDKLITFADLTFGNGSLYRSTGWVEDKTLPPDYFYVRGNQQRYHKFSLRINTFKNNPNLQYEEGLTERELAKLNHFYRVYDAGKIRFVKTHPQLMHR